ncbi:MFS general substrate transporter, partial [Exidia glandulosa HHB12029]
LVCRNKFYQIFLSYGVASGAGLGLILLPSTSVIGQYFNQRLPFASGIAFTGASVGGLSIPPLMNYLLNGNVGYANGMKIIAALLGVLSFVGIALMRPYPARSNAKPTLRTKTGTETTRSMNVAAYAQDVEYVFVVVALFCISLSIVYPLFYLQLDATQHHVSNNVAFNTLTIMNAAAILGRIVPNFLSQRFGLVNTIMFNTLACAAIILAMLSITSSAAAPFLAVAVIYGFFSGAVLSQMTPLLAAQARTVHEIGSRTGVGFLFIGIAMLVGPPIMGALLTKEYHWWRATVYSVVLMVAGAGALAVARRWRVRRLGTPYV